MKKILLAFLLLTAPFIWGMELSPPQNLAEQVGIALMPPVQVNGEEPPDKLTLLLTSPSPLYYKLDLPDKTLSVGRLVKGKMAVSLPWQELENMGRVPLTLAVMDPSGSSKHEFCLIFSQAPRPIDLDGNPLPENSPTLLKDGPQPSISFTQDSKRFEQLLQEIRATPAPARPYELVDRNVYNRFSFSPVNLLLFAASYLVQKLLSRKPEPLTEIACQYARRLETGREWITMRVCLIRVPLPETRQR